MIKSELERALQAHFHASRQRSAQHLPVEDLVAYRSDTLQPEEEQAVRDHLVACEEYSELLLDLAELEETGGLTESVSELEVEAAWRRQHERLFPGRPARRRWPAQLAGWLAAACLGLVASVLWLELRELRRASSMVYDQNLPRVIVAGLDVRSLGNELRTLRFEAGKPGFLLLLLEEDLPFESFRVEFLGPSGEALLTREGLSASEALLLVPVKPEDLPSGRVEIVVSGLQGGRFATVEEYAVRIEHP